MSGAIVVCDEIKAMLEQAYQAGWDESGQGYNGEHPGNAHEEPEWIDKRNQFIETLTSM